MWEFCRMKELCGGSTLSLDPELPGCHGYEQRMAALGPLHKGLSHGTVKAAIPRAAGPVSRTRLGTSNAWFPLCKRFISRDEQRMAYPLQNVTLVMRRIRVLVDPAIGGWRFRGNLTTWSAF
jgi:hypothetical protein